MFLQFPSVRVIYFIFFTYFQVISTKIHCKLCHSNTYPPVTIKTTVYAYKQNYLNNYHLLSNALEKLFIIIFWLDLFIAWLVSENILYEIVYV